MTVSPIRDASGDITGACAITSDITERKFLERQLAQAQKLESIGQLAAGIAHEINTPIQYVGDNTRFLQDAFTRLGQVFQGYEGLLGALQGGADFAPLVTDMQALIKATRVHDVLAEVPQSLEDSLDGIARVAEIVRAIKKFDHGQVPFGGRSVGFLPGPSYHRHSPWLSVSGRWRPAVQNWSIPRLKHCHPATRALSSRPERSAAERSGGTCSLAHSPPRWLPSRIVIPSAAPSRASAVRTRGTWVCAAPCVSRLHRQKPRSLHFARFAPLRSG